LWDIFQKHYNSHHSYITWSAEMEIFGVYLPLWAVFLLGIILVVIAWKLVKFALKILIILVVFLIILIGLDTLGVFDTIQNLLLTIF